MGHKNFIGMAIMSIEFGLSIGLLSVVSPAMAQSGSDPVCVDVVIGNEHTPNISCINRQLKAQALRQQRQNGLEIPNTSTATIDAEGLANPTAAHELPQKGLGQYSGGSLASGSASPHGSVKIPSVHSVSAVGTGTTLGGSVSIPSLYGSVGASGIPSTGTLVIPHPPGH